MSLSSLARPSCLRSLGISDQLFPSAEVLSELRYLSIRGLREGSGLDGLLRNLPWRGIVVRRPAITIRQRRLGWENKL
jgi:hypothetical protein